MSFLFAAIFNCMKLKSLLFCAFLFTLSAVSQDKPGTKAFKIKQLLCFNRRKADFICLFFIAFIFNITLGSINRN
ncbi:MAG: hypothetical protein CFE23_03615 [Flavobacterium sp. BFFFF1]|nr:MAG: hypothetical protein CFE23_03615 [Flavobacterium sp. BFFFF1]